MQFLPGWFFRDWSLGFYRLGCFLSLAGALGFVRPGQQLINGADQLVAGGTQLIYAMLGNLFKNAIHPTRQRLHEVLHFKRAAEEVAR